MKKIVIILISIFLFIGILWWPYITSESNNWIVISKEVKKTKWIDLYLVYVKDTWWNTQTYKISDNFSHFQYNSSDLYWSITEWDEIQFNDYWFRFPFFSLYKNIYKIKIISSTNKKIQDNMNYIYIEKNNNIYRYNIIKKTIKLYDKNIFDKLQSN